MKNASEPLLDRVRAWKRDSEELAEIRKEMDQTISPQMQQAFDDLARQDCRRAASRLGRLFDWTSGEDKLAGEILFMELRRREVTATREVGGGPLCPETNDIGAPCTLPVGHAGPHFREGHIPWTVRP
jgi:hypothetical protein